MQLHFSTFSSDKTPGFEWKVINTLLPMQITKSRPSSQQATRLFHGITFHMKQQQCSNIITQLLYRWPPVGGVVLCAANNTKTKPNSHYIDLAIILRVNFIRPNMLLQFPHHHHIINTSITVCVLRFRFGVNGVFVCAVICEPHHVANTVCKPDNS